MLFSGKWLESSHKFTHTTTKILSYKTVIIASQVSLIINKLKRTFKLIYQGRYQAAFATFEGLGIYTCSAEVWAALENYQRLTTPQKWYRNVLVPSHFILETRKKFSQSPKLLTLYLLRLLQLKLSQEKKKAENMPSIYSVIPYQFNRWPKP